MQTTNYEKHTSRNPIQKLLLANFYREAFKMLRKIKPNSLLDVGAGEGFTLYKLQTEGIGNHLEGIEYMDEAIELGKKLYPQVKITKGDIYKLPYKNNSFDVVISTEVLEHLDKPAQALDELKRVSKSNLLLSVPNEPWFTIQRFLRGKNLLKLGAHSEHIHWWTKNAFIKFLEENKLKILEVKTPFAWTLVLAKK